MRKTRKKVLVFALEATYGVDAVDGGTPSALLGRDVKITPMAGDNTSLSYDDGTLGNAIELATEIYGTVEFAVDVAGSGTANVAPEYGKLLQACLRSVTPGASDVVAAIDDDAAGSLTLYFYYHGALHKLTGARGTFSFSIKAKELPSFKFTFTGLFSPVTGVALPTGLDFTKWKKPVKVGVQNSAFTIGGVAYKLISYEYDQANSVIHQEYVGHEEVEITDYKPTLKIVMEAPDIADWDPFTLAENTTEVATSLTHGPALNQFVHDVPRVSLKRPVYGDQDGTLTYEIDMNVISNGDTITTK
ncbi:hypothetical protein KDN34_02915 [Shewanella yunxiaonensis]|uniref:Major tail protein n=1 Tax=Shewanella yunxiaonensis TaxID=2829809 RepID=A0ABX7YWH8_9GAMM|nr:hypothetical protein [Shewanella yunxiaonensis]QUN06431.1 hypothetical protein KDN34_02915 [Shewanella yunxiaonensis]